MRSVLRAIRLRLNASQQAHTMTTPAQEGRDEPTPTPCPHCGSHVRVLMKRDATVFYVCDGCGTRGAFSVPERPR